MTRDECTQLLAQARLDAGLTYQDIADKLGRHVIWTTAALMANILERSPKLDRASVMETARTLKDVRGVGLELPDATWNTSAQDWFIGETFQLITYDATAGHTNALGPLTNLDGKTAELSPPALLRQ